MALTATIYNLDIELADIDRGVYESFAMRVARQPSETAEYMMTRVLAYCLEYAEGIALTEGTAGDEPAVVVATSPAASRPGLKWACPTPPACTGAASWPGASPSIRTATRSSCWRCGPASASTTSSTSPSTPSTALSSRTTRRAGAARRYRYRSPNESSIRARRPDLLDHHRRASR
jgi:hypothetical protein